MQQKPHIFKKLISRILSIGYLETWKEIQGIKNHFKKKRISARDVICNGGTNEINILSQQGVLKIYLIFLFQTYVHHKILVLMIVVRRQENLQSATNFKI